MAKKKQAKITIFEIIWYIICVLVILWGVTYVVLGIVNKYNDISALKKFETGFISTFKLSLYGWGLIIISIAVVAAVTVMLIYARTFNKAADREERRSARLNALKKEEKVVATQPAEEVKEQPIAENAQEKQAEEPQESVEGKVEEAKAE